MHCVGMCGPIALALPVNPRTAWTRFAGILLYNLGRVFTYAVLGLLFGLVGQGFAFAVSQSALSFTAGILVLLAVLLPYIGFRLPAANFFTRWMNLLKSELALLFSKHGNSSLFVIGLLNGLLPCGLVYMGIAGAVATGDLLQGSAFMAVFGLGTLPAMTLLTYFREAIGFSFRQKIKKTVPLFVGVMGVLLVMRGLDLGIPYLSPSILPSGEIENCCTE